MLEIKTALPEDFEVIRVLAHQTWPLAFGQILSADQIHYMLHKMYEPSSLKHQLEQHHVFLLGFVNGLPQGFASYQLNYSDTAITKLHKLYVLPANQGIGLGKALISEVVKRAKASDQNKLLLNVNRKNAAIQFYSKLGFQIIAEEDIDIGNGYFMNDFVMELSI